jgi:hypothetical protein
MMQMRLTGQGRARCRRLALTAWLFLGCISASSAQTEACPRELAMKAESEASTLETWQSVFVSYKKYRQCDDGAIAEGYSSSIATLLADHWEDIGQLTRFSNQNTRFNKFVLRHVTSTRPWALTKRRRLRKTSRKDVHLVPRSFVLRYSVNLQRHGFRSGNRDFQRKGYGVA